MYEKGKQILKQDDEGNRKVESGDFSRKILLKLRWDIVLYADKYELDVYYEVHLTLICP